MRRLKRIYLLLGALAAACIATFGVMGHEERKEQIRNSEEIILEIPTDSIEAISWEYESETFSFRKGETWIYEKDEAFPVGEEKIIALVEPFSSFGVSFAIEEVEDYSQYGLDDPVCSIQLETEERSYEILLGNYSKMDSQRYVSIGDGNAYLVKEDPLERFAVELHDLICHDEVPYFEKATAIQFAGAENYSIAYEEGSSSAYCADDVYFTERQNEKAPLDTSLVESYLSSVSSLGLTDYVTYNATKEELAFYGLDSPELTIMVDYSNENEGGEGTAHTFSLHISRASKDRNPEPEAEEDGEEEEITAYARVGESQIVYQILGSEYKDLMAASYNDLRHQELLFADFENLTQIEVSLGGEAYTLTSEGKGKGQAWSYQGEEVEISDLEIAFAALAAERFTDEQPTQKQEISLAVYQGEEKDSPILIELYQYDGDTCLALVDGEPVCLVGRSAAVDLIEAINRIVLG